jgi:hypothetical protein
MLFRDGLPDRPPAFQDREDIRGSMRVGRRQRVAGGGQTPVPWRLSRSVIDSVGPAGAEFAQSPCRIFTCVGFMAGSVVCVQIARLWRARGLACLRIVPCGHFPQEDPSGTAGRPGSSPPAPVTHSAGADHHVCRNPQAEHRCSGNWTLWRCRRLGCYRLIVGTRRPRSRGSPAATSAPSCRSCSARWSCVGAKARTGTPRSSSSPATQRHPDPARRPRRRSPAHARSQEHSSASAASRLTAPVLR